jgi:selenium metabolism protein YedF
MAKTIDARGLTCPAPVLLLKDAVERDGRHDMTVLVDNEPCRENVTRFLGSKGYMVTAVKEGEVFRLQATCDGEAQDVKEEAPNESEGEAARQKILVLVTTNRLGFGDDLLGEKLMVNYLKTIKEMGADLWQLIFVNGGVKLTTTSSPVLTELQAYERSGVTVLACGTCLEHFGLTAEKKVGASTNMLDIVTATQLADKVITIG